MNRLFLCVMMAAAISCSKEEVAPIKVTTIGLVERSLKGFTVRGRVDVGSQQAVRGVCYSPLPNPTVNDAVTMDGSGPGLYTSTVNAVDARKRYYVRAYVVDGQVTTYGDQISVFTNCPSSFQGDVTYHTQVTNASLPFSSCQDISGTMAIVQNNDTGVYTIADISFGMYLCVYGQGAASGVNLEIDCNGKHLLGEDQYGATYTWDSFDEVTGVIHWSTSFGESGITRIIR